MNACFGPSDTCKSKGKGECNEWKGGWGEDDEGSGGGSGGGSGKRANQINSCCVALPPGCRTIQAVV